MHPIHEAMLQTRRNFLATSAGGLGTLAVASLLREEGLLAADATEGKGKEDASPLAPRPPHFAAKAKACIWNMRGAQNGFFRLKKRIVSGATALMPRLLGKLSASMVNTPRLLA